jgi:hypothetical protein
MGYWIYMQAFLDVALLLAVAALVIERRRRPSAKAWQREVGALVDTLSELVVEVDRVTTPRPPAASGDAPPQAVPIDESALAERVFAGDDDGPAFLPADAPAEATSDTPPDVQSDAPAPAARPGGLLDEVLACAREGLSPEDIARRVGRPVGEVTLMLGLSRAHAVPAGR